jgi:hypothetical protein
VLLRAKIYFSDLLNNLYSMCLFCAWIII